MLMLSRSFTNLVQQDHENEQSESRAKVAMDSGDETVEKGFSGPFVLTVEL